MSIIGHIFDIVSFEFEIGDVLPCDIIDMTNGPLPDYTKV